MRKVRLKKYKEMSLNKVKNVLKPKYVYIPIIDNDKSLVKKGDSILKHQALTITDDGLVTSSPISGTILGKSRYLTTCGELTKCYVIENDFKELSISKKTAVRHINKISHEDFINILKECGIVGLGGGGFPTYKKYLIPALDILIVNGVECEPYITADYVLMENKVEEILESIDAIIEINSLSRAYLAIKETHVDLINMFNKYIGSYPNITLELVADYYPNGWERYLVKNILNKSYDKYPSEIGVVVNNVSTIYAIYEALKYNKTLIERIITVTGENMINPGNYLIKIGTGIYELLSEVGGVINPDDSYLIAGGPMMGIGLETDEILLRKTNNCLLSISKTICEQKTCLNCGKCSDICPQKLSPVLIMKCQSDRLLPKLHPEKCIECGCCSYVCPAKIEIREAVVGAKKKVME